MTDDLDNLKLESEKNERGNYKICEDEVKRKRMIDGWKYCDRGRLKDDGSDVTMSYEIHKEIERINSFEEINDWKKIC